MQVESCWMQCAVPVPRLGFTGCEYLFSIVGQLLFGAHGGVCFFLFQLYLRTRRMFIRRMTTIRHILWCLLNIILHNVCFLLKLLSFDLCTMLGWQTLTKFLWSSSHCDVKWQSVLIVPGNWNRACTQAFRIFQIKQLTGTSKHRRTYRGRAHVFTKKHACSIYIYNSPVVW